MARHSNNPPKSISHGPAPSSGLGLGLSLFLTLILILGVIFLSLSSCDSETSGQSFSAFIDEAFAGLFPDASAALAANPGLVQISTPGSPKDSPAKNSKTVPSFPNLSSLEDSALNLVQGWESGKPQPKVLIASPLAAAQLLKAQTSLRSLPRLVVPFAASLSLPSPIAWGLEYDYPAAYSELGEKAARLLQPSAPSSRVSSSTKVGSYCLVIFEANMLRGRETLDAFAESFEKIAGEDRLKLEIASPYSSAADRTGAFNQILANYKGTETSGPAVVFFATDNLFGVEEAVKKATLSRKDGQGDLPAYFADCGSWGKGRADSRLFAWRIEADEARLARAGSKAARSLLKSGADADQELEKDEMGLSLVPLRIISQGKK